MNNLTTNKELTKKIKNLPALSPEAIQKMQEGLYEGRPLIGENGIMSGLLKSLLEISLQGEMDEHIAENSLEAGTNRKNGVNQKTVKSAVGNFELSVPRDRNGSFEPQLVKKLSNSFK